MDLDNWRSFCLFVRRNKAEVSVNRLVAVKGIRNIVVHEYFGIKFDLIWEVAVEPIPVLKEQVEIMIKELN